MWILILLGLLLGFVNLDTKGQVVLICSNNCLKFENLIFVGWFYAVFHVQFYNINKVWFGIICVATSLDDYIIKFHMQYFLYFYNFNASGLDYRRYDKANKKGFSRAYFPWLVAGYGFGECSYDMFVLICLQNLNGSFASSYIKCDHVKYKTFVKFLLSIHVLMTVFFA